MDTCVLAAPLSTKNVGIEDVRRSVTFRPSLWGDHFLAYSSTKISEAEANEHERHKEMVRDLISQTPNDSTLKIELIDAIQRLGVGYHFEKEIEDCLQDIYNKKHPTYDNKDEDLYVTALRFRLLRQQGHRVPCDIFSKFVDDEGNFKASLKDDIEGMLSLYEASNLGVHGEEILDKALEFTSSHLRILAQRTAKSLSARINEALENPISKTLIKVGARKFIPMYQENEAHNQILLKLAKLDFNKVQKIYQKELCNVTRWWKDLDFVNKLPFARDRVVEGYLWSWGVYFEPKYHFGRIALTKIFGIFTIIDDIYDVYGTIEELEQFTNFVQSWKVEDLDQLPPYMRTCYGVFLQIYDELEDEMVKAGELYRVQYAKEETKKVVKAYFEEAKWCFSQYRPTMEEYMKLALASVAYIMLSTISLVGMGDQVTKHDFDWISSPPRIVHASSIICRLMDDLAGHQLEKKIMAVDCYMNETGASELEAYAELGKRVKDAWKVINEECLEPKAASMPILLRVVNLARVMHLLYLDGNGYTNPGPKTKEIISSMFIEPVAI